MTKTSATTGVDESGEHIIEAERRVRILLARLNLGRVDEIIAQALRAAGLPELPRDHAELATFVEGHLATAVGRRIGPTAALTIAILAPAIRQSRAP